jgi:hypothetical protein
LIAVEHSSENDPEQHSLILPHAALSRGRKPHIRLVNAQGALGLGSTKDARSGNMPPASVFTAMASSLFFRSTTRTPVQVPAKCNRGAAGPFMASHNESGGDIKAFPGGVSIHVSCEASSTNL